MPGVNPNLAQHPAFAAAYQQQLLQQQLMQQQMAMQVSWRGVRARAKPWQASARRDAAQEQRAARLAGYT